MTNKPKRGRGRPRTPEGPKKTVGVLLTNDQIAKAERIGNGNLSEGVRLCVEHVDESAIARPDA